MRPRLTYANVVATLALFLALGGGGTPRSNCPLTASVPSN
jgi:hypothetical protein